MEAKKNLQLVDLGLDRRIEITTADDKRDPYARYNEKDLDTLRKSVQDPQAVRLQDQHKKHLDAWSNFHQEVKLEDGEYRDEPQLMNGQSHRAHLHFDMRHKESLVSRHFAPSRNATAGRKHHLDPALDIGKVSFGGSNPPGLVPGIIKPAFAISKKGPRFAKHKGLNSQRRPIRALNKSVINILPQSNEVKLADPRSWLNSVRIKADQPDTSVPSTSQLEIAANTKSPFQFQQIENKSVRVTTPVATTQAPAVIKPVVKMPTNMTTEPAATIQPAGITQMVPTTSTIGLTRPVVAKQIDVTTTSSAAKTAAKPASAVQPVATPKTTGIPKLVLRLENPFFDSNLPQPQTNSSSSRTQSQFNKVADLLINFDSLPKKKGPGPMKSASEPDMMDLDEDGDKPESETVAATSLEKKLAWVQELGFINDTLADFSLTDKKQVKQLEDRRIILQGMIHSASSRKISKTQQTTSLPDKLIELSPSLKKAITAQPFVPPPKPMLVEAKAAVIGGLQASRWADPVVGLDTPREKSPKKTFESKKPTNAPDDNRDYWQKTLPKLPPLPADFMKNAKPPAPTSSAPKKPTKSICESRYAY